MATDAQVQAAANNNEPAPTDAISFTDLAAALGIDEDTLLQRLAKVLSKREARALLATPGGDESRG